MLDIMKTGLEQQAELIKMNRKEFDGMGTPMETSLDDAVNNALDDLDLQQNKHFIDLMTALYNDIDDLVEGHKARCDIEPVYDAIGHFVPSEES